MNAQVNSKIRCWMTQRQLSAYVDGALPAADRRLVGEHADRCRDCALKLDQLTRTRANVRTLPPVMAPERLTVALRVAASRERARRLERLDWRSSLQFRLENLMRPLALPFAGGLVSAVFLFSMLAPSYPMQGKDDSNDVPTMLYTEATVKSVVPFLIGTDEVVVDLVIDEQGSVVDYQFDNGVAVKNPALRRAIEANLLFTRFTPATTFGQPTFSRLRLTFRHSYIDVKG